MTITSNQTISTPVTANAPVPLIPPSSAIIQPTSQNSGFDPLQPQKTIDELLAQNPTPTPSTDNKINNNSVNSPSDWNPWNNNTNINGDSGFSFQNQTQTVKPPTQLIMQPQQQQQQQPRTLSSNNPFLQDHVPSQISTENFEKVIEKFLFISVILDLKIYSVFLFLLINGSTN